MEQYTIFGVIWDLIRGKLELTTKEVATKRYAECQECEVRNHTLDICTICGCSLKLKTKIKKTSCPMEKW